MERKTTWHTGEGCSLSFGPLLCSSYNDYRCTAWPLHYGNGSRLELWDVRSGDITPSGRFKRFFSKSYKLSSLSYSMSVFFYTLYQLEEFNTELGWSVSIYIRPRWKIHYEINLVSFHTLYQSEQFILKLGWRVCLYTQPAWDIHGEAE